MHSMLQLLDVEGYKDFQVTLNPMKINMQMIELFFLFSNHFLAPALSNVIFSNLAALVARWWYLPIEHLLKCS